MAIAHRGGAHEAPENSVDAFRAAYDMGYRWLETDAHVTLDRVVAAFHDPRLDRVTDRRGRIGELTWSAIRDARIEGSGRIPAMSDLLRDFPDARFNIDTKSDAVVEPLIELIGEHDAWDRVCVGSFFDRRLRRARALAGDRLCTSAGPLQIGVQLGRAYRAPLRRIGADVLQIPVRFRGVPLANRRLVRSAHAEGLAVHVWTVDDRAEMHRLFDLGVDGIMTDRPAVLREVMVERGYWSV